MVFPPNRGHLIQRAPDSRQRKTQARLQHWRDKGVTAKVYASQLQEHLSLLKDLKRAPIFSFSGFGTTKSEELLVSMTISRFSYGFLELHFSVDVQLTILVHYRAWEGTWETRLGNPNLGTGLGRWPKLTTTRNSLSYLFECGSNLSFQQSFVWLQPPRNALLSASFA